VDAPRSDKSILGSGCKHFMEFFVVFKDMLFLIYASPMNINSGLQHFHFGKWYLIETQSENFGEISH